MPTVAFISVVAFALMPAVALSAAGTGSAAPVVAPTILTTAEAAARLSPELSDREGWAQDVVAALAKIGRVPSAVDLCAVFAVINTTSEFTTEVRVDRSAPFDFSAALDERFPAGIASIVQLLLRRRDEKSGATYAERFGAARTEAEFDDAFLDLLASLRADAPVLYAAAEWISQRRHGVSLVDLDPIRTVGPMQVSVRWAAVHAGAGIAAGELRRLLHSRRGGIEFGVARLLGWEQRYDDVHFLLADYHAGLFASRNAAFQELVARLTSGSLGRDGDLLRYGPSGLADAESETLARLRQLAPALEPQLDGDALRRDLQLEKTLAFEATATWLGVRALAARRLAIDPAYARLPDISVRGPKQKAPFKVRGWVRSALLDYHACLAGGQIPRRTGTRSPATRRR